MFLLNSLNLLLDGRKIEDGQCSHSASNAPNNVPEGQLTSAAWEGWRYEKAA